MQDALERGCYVNDSNWWEPCVKLLVVKKLKKSRLSEAAFLRMNNGSNKNTIYLNGLHLIQFAYVICASKSHLKWVERKPRVYAEHETIFNNSLTGNMCFFQQMLSSWAKQTTAQVYSSLQSAVIHKAVLEQGDGPRFPPQATQADNTSEESRQAVCLYRHADIFWPGRAHVEYLWHSMK